MDWISSKDRLPGEGIRVLAYRPRTSIKMQIIEWWRDETEFTHWMPLPPPPEAE